MMASFQIERESVTLHCSQHGEFEGFRKLIFSTTIYTKCPHCEENELRDKEEKELSERWYQHRKAIKLPVRFETASFSNYSTPTYEHEKALHGGVEYAADVARYQYVNLILMGKVGTGKTHIAAAICNQLAGQCISARYSSVRDIVRSVRETWGNSNDSESGVLERYTKPYVLIIDEVGIQQGSANEQNILFDVINRRYESMLPVVLVSNLDARGIKAAIGDRSFDRVREAASVIPFTWESFRRQANSYAR